MMKIAIMFAKIMALSQYITWTSVLKNAKVKDLTVGLLRLSSSNQRTAVTTYWCICESLSERQHFLIFFGRGIAIHVLCLQPSTLEVYNWFNSVFFLQYQLPYQGKVPCLPYYLPIAEEKINGFIIFPRVLVLWEMFNLVQDLNIYNRVYFLLW